MKRWDGGAWADVGSGSVSGTPNSSGSPCVAIDRAGRPVVAWDESIAGRYVVMVKRWDGRAWVAAGPDAVIDSGHHPSITFDAGGRAIVAMHEDSSGEVRVFRWAP
jgi:hypothetical protein